MMLFQQRNAADMGQQPIDEGGRGQREQALRIVARQIEGEQRPRAPEQEFEKIIGMTRKAPQADLA